MDGQSGSSSVGPDWYADPTGRHQHRYWDGRSWTEHVADDGKASIDPVADAKTRLESVRALEGTRGPRATDALIAALSDQDIEVRKCAARALGGRPGATAVQPLLACLDSENASLRVYAMESLIETEAAEEALVAALAKREPQSPDPMMDSLAEAVRLGRLKTSSRCNRILRLAFRESWMSPKSLALLGLLIENGDPLGPALAQAVDSSDSAAVEQLLRST